MIDTRALREEQRILADQIELQDPPGFTTPALIAGVDVGFEQGGEVTRAAVAVLSYPTLELVEYQIARIPTVMPYIPGFLSFRELPALLQAWQQISSRPDLVMVDGQGIAHPRRLGEDRTSSPSGRCQSFWPDDRRADDWCREKPVMR